MRHIQKHIEVSESCHSAADKLYEPHPLTTHIAQDAVLGVVNIHNTLYKFGAIL